MNDQNYQLAIQDFRNARREASMRQLLHRLTGKSDELLAYNSVSKELGVTQAIERGISEIPLAAIVGSVGRAKDFTRDFLPRRDSDIERWSRVKAAVLDMKGWPPIDVYKMGDSYFVIDGNHRVSVANQLGSRTITAHVTEVETELPFTLIEEAYTSLCKTNYQAFLDHTHIHECRPQAALYLTYCQHYQVLLDQIDNHATRVHSQLGHDLPYEEIVVAWYDDVYLPVLDIIREQGSMHNFQDRTEADLYVLLSERRHELEEALGWHIDERAAVLRVAPQLDEQPRTHLSNLGRRLRNLLHPEQKSEPLPGTWRKEIEAMHRKEALFQDILVSIQGTDADWSLLENAMQLAKREDGRILALHALSTDQKHPSRKTATLLTQFQRRIKKAGVRGELAFEAGDEGRLMLKRAAYVDLVTTNLTFQTGASTESPLGEEANELIRRCPRPILVQARNQETSQLKNPLLAYDGSPKSDEALFVAAYMAARWGVHLTVVTVETAHTNETALEHAKEYLAQRNIAGDYHYIQHESCREAITKAVSTMQADLLIMGGFGHRPSQQLFLGSTVYASLRTCRQPLLICR